MQRTSSSSGPQKAAAAEEYVPGGYAAGNRGADYVKCLAPALAPEQGT